MFQLRKTTRKTTAKVIAEAPYVSISGWSDDDGTVASVGIEIIQDGEALRLCIPLDKIGSVIQRLQDAQVKADAGKK